MVSPFAGCVTSIAAASSDAAGGSDSDGVTGPEKFSASSMSCGRRLYQA